MFFFKHGSLSRRMAVAKIMGMTVGVLGGLLVAPYLLGEVSAFFRWGIFAWHLTLGGIVGIFGVVTECPHFGKHCPFHKNKKFRPFLRGALAGAWLNFVITLVAFESISEMFLFAENIPVELGNPLIWIPIVGAVIGGIVDIVATRYGGEGKEIL
ncbi:MAG: hypothetical protein OEL89_01590 [Candidatus Peregrinibacteria bacterium]|nr:hypothetical protein [Candidatus Peregrinibacteria bacterium]